MRLILFIILVFSSQLTAFDTYYHTVKVQNGDGILSLLRRYHLLDNQCNIDHFLQLNDLKPKQSLQVDKEYKLPILIYAYNGTSIRTTVGINDWEQAVRIKEYNEKILTNNLRKTRYVDSKILWVPYHELHCKINDADLPQEVVSSKVEQLKSAPKSGNYVNVELFGKKHQRVEIIDNSLKGKVYYIVSGHGGPDPGAICTECSNHLCEDEYAYDVCLRMSRYFISRGASVHMIIQDKNDGIREEEELECDKDEVCMGAKIPRNQKRRLAQRAVEINNLYKKYKKQGVKEQIAIMVHVDSYTEERRQDVYFFHHLKSKSSKALAQSLQNTFKKKYNYYQKGRGYKGFVKGRGLYMLNNTLPTATYVELANIRNPHDQKRLKLQTNREALAKWLFEGIVAYQKS